MSEKNIQHEGLPAGQAADESSQRTDWLFARISFARMSGGQNIKYNANKPNAPQSAVGSQQPAINNKIKQPIWKSTNIRIM
jgi:hypothetical protein